MPDYAWVYLNMPEYAGICVNMPEWLVFYISQFPHFLNNPFFTRTRDYLFERLQKTRGNSLKEHEAVFLNRQYLIFSMAAGSVSFVFCFRLNIFTSKI